MQRDDLLLQVREGEKLDLGLRPKKKYAGNWRRPWVCGLEAYVVHVIAAMIEKAFLRKKGLLGCTTSYFRKRKSCDQL